MLKNLNQIINPISKPDIQYRGKKYINPSVQTVYVSNHISPEDISLLDGLLPESVHIFIREKEAQTNTSVLKKREFTSYKELSDSLIQKMTALWNEGKSLFFFPEDSTSSSDIVMPVAKEFFPLFTISNLRICPVAITGAPYIKSCPFKDTSLKTSDSIIVQAGEPFYLSFPNQPKEVLAHKIYKELQDLKFCSIDKKNVNLFNQMVHQVKYAARKDTLIKDENNSLTYQQFLLSTNVLGVKFTRLFGDEKRLGVLLPTTLGFALTLFALFKSKKTPVMLNFSMGIQTLTDCCETANIRTILTSREFIKKANLQPLIDALSGTYRILYLEDIKKDITSSEKMMGLADTKRYAKVDDKNGEIILFTSGSENKPKGVVLSHDNVFANIQQVVTTIDINSTDSFMNVLPMFHSFGMTAGCILPVLYGLDVFLYPSPINYKSIPKIVYEEKSTLLFATSTFFLNYGKMAEKHHFQSLKYTVAGAERLSDGVRTLWMEKFGIRILEGYGVTETSPVLSLNRPATYEKGSAGQLLPGIKSIIEPVEGIPNGGNLLVKGPNVMKGYLKHGIGFEPHDRWYRTGDIVEMNEYEQIFIKSRLKRFAKIGGEMVSLTLVEQTASSCFEHTGVAAVSIPDKRKGERVILFTTSDADKERALKKYIKEHKLSNLLNPYKIEHIEEIPILGTGKTNYVELEKTAREIYL